MNQRVFFGAILCAVLAFVFCRPMAGQVAYQIAKATRPTDFTEALTQWSLDGQMIVAAAIAFLVSLLATISAKEQHS